MMESIYCTYIKGKAKRDKDCVCPKCAHEINSNSLSESFAVKKTLSYAIEYCEICNRKYIRGRWSLSAK